jgi:hypothetical protein
MRRIRIASVVTILVFAPIAIAQQVANKASSNSQQSGSPTSPPGPSSVEMVRQITSPFGQSLITY